MSHGNSKQRREPYSRTYLSVIKRIKKESEHFSPKNVVSNIRKQAGGAFEMSSPFEVARDGMQIYNAVRHVDKPKVTMKHPMFLKKNDPLSHPGVVVALATSATKEYEDCKFIAEKIIKFVAGKPIVYGTDVELVIKKAFEKEFPIEDLASDKQNIHLRCFAHVKIDVENFLLEKTSLDGKSRNKIIADILGKDLNSVRYK